MKKIIYILIVFLFIFFLALAGLWNAYRYHSEKKQLAANTKSSLIMINNALTFYVQDHGSLPAKLEDLAKEDKYMNKESLLDKKIRDINFINWTEDYEKIPFIYCNTLQLKDGGSKNLIIAAEPISTEGVRFVLLYQDYQNPDKLKASSSYVIRIPEEQFRKQAEKQGWKDLSK